MYFSRLAYRPVSGERKSGMPDEVLMPAPARTTIFFARLELSSSQTEATVGVPFCVGPHGEGDEEDEGEEEDEDEEGDIVRTFHSRGNNGIESKNLKMMSCASLLFLHLAVDR